MGVGVLSGRGITAEGILTKFGMEIPHSPGKVIGYVVGVASGRALTTEGILTKFGMEIPHTHGKVIGYGVEVASRRERAKWAWA